MLLSEKLFDKKNTSQTLNESDKINIKTMLNKLSTKEITNIMSQNSKVPKKEIYEYCLKLKNENKLLILFFISIILSGCAGVASKGIFGTGVSVAFDPRTVGTQVDDSIMQKNLSARILLMDKKYLLSVKTKVLDGRIFFTGKVDNPEEKLKLTKLCLGNKRCQICKK